MSNEWQTIKTAPKDGTRVLLYGKEGTAQHINPGYYDPSPQLGPYPKWRWGLTYYPTHWMPLPEPPK